MKIIFFGTSPYAAGILRSLVEKKFNIAAIVTRPDKPRGRSQRLLPTAVKEAALTLLPNCPTYQPARASTPEFADELKKLGADLFVVVAYGEIIKENLLSIPPKGAINIHASLLPKYRGAAPIHRALLEGEKESGVTIIDMVLEMDAGDMLGKSVVPITDEMTFEQLNDKLLEAGQKLLPEVIAQIEKGEVEREKQQLDLVTFAAKIQPEELEIDFSKSAREVHNQVRALRGSFCTVVLGEEKKRMKILQTVIADEKKEAEVGEVLFVGKRGIQICCGKGVVELLEIQLEGKKRLFVKDFINGLQESFSLCLNN